LNPFGVHAASFQDLNRAARETTLWEAGVAFHEKHNVVGFNQLVDAGLGV
jgi:hypothetical protein